LCNNSSASKSLVIPYKPQELLFDVYKAGKTVKVFIDAKYFYNREPSLIRKIWGTDVYAEESDLVTGKLFYNVLGWLLIAY